LLPNPYINCVLCFSDKSWSQRCLRIHWLCLWKIRIHLWAEAIYCMILNLLQINCLFFYYALCADVKGKQSCQLRREIFAWFEWNLTNLNIKKKILLTLPWWVYRQNELFLDQAKFYSGIVFLHNSFLISFAFRDRFGTVT
jgi:hypothetical protein